MEKEKNKDGRQTFFRLDFRREEPAERIWSRHFTRSGLVWTAISAAVILLLVNFCLIAVTPLRTFIPGYPDARSRQQAVRNAQRIDSLETQILRWELYTENLRRVVAASVADPAADSLLRAVVRQEEHPADTTK